MHKILNATARSLLRGESADGKSDSVNEHARLYTYTFLITAHLYVDKRGTGGLNKWASLNKLPCIITYACVPVIIPYQYGARLAVMLYE